MRKIIWSCYVITFVLLLAILFGGLSGAFDDGYTYRLLNFYFVIPVTLFAMGSFLGYKDAHFKWLYPVLFGFLTRVVVLQFVNLQVGLHFLPFLCAFLGMVSGITARLVLQNLSKSAQAKLKKIAKVVCATAGAIVLIHIVHAVTLDRTIEYKELFFSSPNIPAEMNGYRIAFVADTHNLPMYQLKAVVEELNHRHVDLLLLGGDFSAAYWAQWQSMEILSQTITTDGIFGVEGNHDNYRYLFEAKRAFGIVPLSNNGVLVRENFFLAGVEDLWNRNPNIADAIENSSPEDFVLLVSHNPDVAMKQDTIDVDLIVSGHTHGGQITFFGVWAPYFTFGNSVTEYGQQFASTWAESPDGIPILISNGLCGYVIRVFARPQVILLTLIQS